MYQLDPLRPVQSHVFQSNHARAAKAGETRRIGGAQDKRAGNE